MSDFNNFGGLKSQTGSVGGGSGVYAGDRGILFPEFDEWARINKAILKTNTRAKLTDRGIEETITIDIDFNDNLWRPSSTIIANSELPKKGDEHPTISGCLLDDISITNFNNQPDHFRATLNYKYPENENSGGSGGGGGGGGGEALTPVDEPFLINFTPVITRIPLAEDISVLKQPIVNPNGEPYDIKVNKVRLDGVCKWNQFDWDEEDTSKWTNVLNKDTWEVGEYKFAKETILLNYVVGNVSFFTDKNGKRIRYYKMEAGISYDNSGWGEGNGVISVRQQGSFYYNVTDKKLIKSPRDRSTGQRFDLDDKGGLLSGDSKVYQVKDGSEKRVDFKVYEVKNFNFVDL